jgi:hypothetical protein
MKARLPTGLMTLAFVAVFLFIGLIPSQKLQARPRIDADIALFYDALRPYGEWVSHRTYGTVWYPTDVPRNWRPYTDGHWAYTQQYGWLWVSDQPWGWAPFHYGRWAWDNWYGWIWVPGRTWAPAWVFWRSGSGYAAWAPMPPNVLWQPNSGLNTQYFNDDRDLYWDSWVVVSEYNLPHRNLHNHIFNPSQNRHIMSRTSHSNNLTVINQSIVNQGIPVTRIERTTGTRVATVVPVVNENIEKHHRKHQQDDAPEIIRPNSAEHSTSEEIRKSEELAIRLDQKKVVSLQPPVPTESNLTGTDNQEQPRIPERLKHEHNSTKFHEAPNDRSGPENIQPAEQFLPDTLPSSPPATTSAEKIHPEFINQPVNQDNAPEALRPSDTEEQPVSPPVSPVNLLLPNDQTPSQSSERKPFKPQPETTPLPGFQDQHPIEMPQPEPVRKQEPPVQVPEEPIVDQQVNQPIQPEKISGQEIIQPIQMDLQQQERAAVQDEQNQPPVEVEPIHVEVPPVQMPQEPIGDQQAIQQIQQQETTNQELSQTGNQQQESPVVQESQVEQAAQKTQPEPTPAPQPEIQTQPPIEVQQQPEPPHQQSPPVPQQEATTQPKNPCQPTEQNDCSK